MTSTLICTNPKITIGIPTLNRRSYLMLALESVLAQSYKNIEVIVSDNASTDDTLEHLSTVTDDRVRVLHQSENIGMVENFNATLKAATGELFLLLSDDDILEPTAIEQLSAPFRGLVVGLDSSKVGLSWSPNIIIDSAGVQLYATEAGPSIETPVQLLRGVFDGRRGTRLSSILIRTIDSLKYGGYDGSRHGVLCDTGNWSRCAVLHDWVYCTVKPLVQYRVHAASETQVASCADWQLYATNISEDVLAVLVSRNDTHGAHELGKSTNNILANCTVTILLRFVGRPGWIALFAREFWRSRRFMITPFVFRRILKDGFKLLRLRGASQ
jgi:glycosyltransferase involved in cell wall biosynthesis